MISPNPDPMTAQPPAGSHRSRMVRRGLFAGAMIVMLAASGAVVISANAAVPPTSTGWTQTFLDDFDGSTLSGDWLHSEGTSYPGGPANFGTGEVESNSRDNVTVADGVMSITAKGQGLGPWTSDRIETTRSDFEPPAGGKLRVEARLQLPEAADGQSNGYWPAFWMLGAPYRGNGWNWPTVGEIDIMENVSGLNQSWQTMHCGWLDPATGPNVCNETNGIGNNGSAGPCGEGTDACTKAFHTYTIDWSRADESVTWYVDGREVWRTQRGVNVPTDAWDLGFEGHGFFIILNLAIGGQMPANNGVPLGSATTGGGHLDADYVAVYTGAADAPSPSGSTSASPSGSTSALPTGSTSASPTGSTSASPTGSTSPSATGSASPSPTVPASPSATVPVSPSVSTSSY
jgi:beta-glucanase (GH16 family)